MSNKWYGWRPSKPDFRDRRFQLRPMSPANLPPSVSLRDKMPPVYDQGALGSCTAQAIAGAIEYLRIKSEAAEDFTPSRLFIYYEERVMEDSVKEDAGAEIRDGIKVVASTGAPHERVWPYDLARWSAKPSTQAYDDAKANLIGAYRKIDGSNLNAIKTALVMGLPVIFGFSVYEEFESDEVAHTGFLRRPSSASQMLGGHAVMIVGYDDATQRFTVRNSWGEDWGDKGYFTMGYDYATDPDLASDFWAIEAPCEEGVSV